MQKSVMIVALVALGSLAVALAAEFNENQEVRDSAKDARLRGLLAFGGAPSNKAAEGNKYVPTPKPAQSQVFSQYTRKLSALGGGKPRLADQYRYHSYVPLAPSVVPVEHPVLANGKLTPEAAAKIYRPQRPYQFTTDHLY